MQFIWNVFGALFSTNLNTAAKANKPKPQKKRYLTALEWLISLILILFPEL